MPEHRLKVCERSSRRQKCIFSSGDFDSAQSPCYIYYYYRCLNLSKAHSIPPPVISTPLNHRCYIYCYSRCLSLSKAHSYSHLPCDFDSAQSPCYIYYYSRCLSTDWRSANEVHEGTFSLILPVISAPLNHHPFFCKSYNKEIVSKFVKVI